MKCASEVQECLGRACLVFSRLSGPWLARASALAATDEGTALRYVATLINNLL